MVELEVGVFASPPKSALPMASLQRRSAAQPASVVSTVASFKAQNSFACLWERGISAIPSSAPPFGMPAPKLALVPASITSRSHAGPEERLPAHRLGSGGCAYRAARSRLGGARWARLNSPF
jgi:hypothetical protein